MLILIRGLPGSGKSWLAKKLSDEIDAHHFETDMFFMNNGRYDFDIERIREAHQWCQGITRESLNRGYNVVVSNTFTQKWEMQPYLDMTEKIQIMEPETPWAHDPMLCYGRQSHGVPIETIKRMASRWERVLL